MGAEQGSTMTKSLPTDEEIVSMAEAMPHMPEDA